MANRVVTGEYQPHLESELVREVRVQKESNPLSPLIIVVPTNFLALHLSRLLAREMGGHAELHFLTLLDLARRLGERSLALKGLSAMPPMADQLVFSQAVRACLHREDGSYFGGVSDTDGFLRVFLEAVGDLKEGCLRPDDLLAALDEARLRPVARDKIREVVALWTAYEDGKTSAGFYDRPELMFEAAANASTDRWFAGMREMLIYGFYDFNPLQKRLVEQCLSVKETVFYFPYRDEPAFDYVRPTLKWLKSLRIEFMDEPVYAGTSPPGLKGLKTALFTDSVSQAESTDGVAVLSAPGEIREGVEICRELLRLIGSDHALFVNGEGGVAAATVTDGDGATPAAGRHGTLPVTDGDGATPGADVDGLRLNEVGILLREPARYASHLARAFDTIGVEPFITEGLSLGRSRAARSLVLLVELIESDFARRQVMDFLTFAEIDFGSFLKGNSDARRRRLDSSSVGKPPISEVEGANPALWDLLSKEAGVVKGADAWGKKLSALRSRRRPPHDAGESDGEERARAYREREMALDTLGRFMEKLAAWMRSFPRVDSPAKLAEETISLYGALIAPSPDRDRVIRAIGDLALLDTCARTVERTFFFWLARRHLEQLQSSLGSFQGDGPVVAGLMAARGLPFKVVVLPGLAEGWFPKAARQDPVLLDGERTTLNKTFAALGVEGELGLKADRLSEEKLLFRLGVGAASRRVLFVFPRLDPFTGAERVPSSFLLEAVRAVTGRPCDASSLDSLSFSKRVPLATLFPEDDTFLEQREFDLRLAEISMRQAGSPALAHLERGDTFFKNVIEAAKGRWGKSVFTCYDGAMESPEAISLLRGRYVGGAGVVAPTSLETYASCPFVYFMRHILGIRSVEDPEELLSITPMDRGGLAHAILERAYREIFAEGEKPRSDWQVIVRSKAREVLDSFRSKSDFGLPLLWELEEERLVDDLLFSVRQDLEDLDGFAPWELELAYGFKRGDRELDPLRFPLGESGHIALGGVMDRVDRDRDAGRAKVVDYKTGSGSAYKDNSFRGGSTLQLPLYVLGARHILGDESEVDGAEYFFVAGPRRGSRVTFTAGSVDERVEDLKTILGTIVRGVEAGLFFASPGASCQYCDYAMACGACRRLFDRKQTDPRAEAFLHMLEID